jgi:hypothetical protein
MLPRVILAMNLLYGGLGGIISIPIDRYMRDSNNIFT